MDVRGTPSAPAKRISAENEMRHTERCASEAVEKLSFSEQPLARNHAFERISKKNRVLRTHFFFPCINSEIHKVNCRIAAREGGLDHAPGIYEFAKQIRLNACYRTKHIADSRNYDLQEEKTDRFAVCLFCAFRRKLPGTPLVKYPFPAGMPAQSATHC